VRVGAIQIANGFSSEARVLAGIIRHRPDGSFHVVQHEWTGDHASARQFRDAAGVPTDTWDFGWRPRARRRRELPAKVVGRARLPFALRRLAGWMDAADVDVVLSSQQAWDCAAATHVAERLGVPQVVHLHYIVGPWLGRVPLRRLQECAHVVAVSDFVRGQVIDHGVPADRVTTVHNTLPSRPTGGDDDGASLRDELGLGAAATIVAFVGRLDPYKGHAEALDAFDAVAGQHPDAHLVVAGDGTLADELRARAASGRAAARVHFLGQRADVDRILASADVFVHPSYDEPFGLAVLEAAAAGLPVVAFRCGGIPEIVHDGVTGLLAARGDVTELAAHLDTLLADDALRGRLGAAAGARAREEFRPVDAAARYMDVLRAVVGGAQRR
jgi:glycosyltransferase involved in cell wall biosynthesis